MRWFLSPIGFVASATASLSRLLLVVAVLGAVLIAPTAASASQLTATEPDSRGGVVADFDITGYRCSTEVVRERERRNGTTVTTTIESGLTEASIPLLSGQLTIRSTTVIDESGAGRVWGRWTLDPDASTGSIVGRLKGRISADGSAEIESFGRGRRALRGVAVKIESEATPGRGTGDEEAPCEADATFVGKGTATGPAVRAPRGAVVQTGVKAFDQGVADLIDAIEINPNLRLIQVVDHAAAAASRGLTLPPTTEVFFGNPNLGTPLMSASQTTGIDLPQKILIWEDLFGIVRVAYNSVNYLQSRHGIEGADPQLTTIAGALAGLSGIASGVPSDPVTDGRTVREGFGLVTIRSDQTADDAFAAIVAALEAAPPINVVFTLEHDQNPVAMEAGLRPTKLIVFGNPSLGTPLMQTKRSIALDLPQKILVYSDADGQTMIAFNDPRTLANRHRLRGQADLLDTIRGALDNFASVGS